ncbi:MAG: aminoglycoside phosphotransferase family protein [Spirochaetaceae bacterium]
MAWVKHNNIIIMDFIKNYCNENRYNLNSFEPWKEGASNSIWKLEYDNKKCVLKVGKLDYWRKLDIESKILKIGQGLYTPEYIDSGKASESIPWDWAIIKRIDGTHPFSIEDEDLEELSKLLLYIRKEIQPKNLSKGDWKSFLNTRIIESINMARKNAPERIMNRFDNILNLLKSCDEIGEKLDNQPMGIIQGDFTPLNLIKKRDGSFTLLDWENPRLGSIAWDLSNIKKSFNLTDRVFKHLVNVFDQDIDYNILNFTSSLYNLHVASWRIEMWYGREKKDYGDLFLIEMGEELAISEFYLKLILN